MSFSYGGDPSGSDIDRIRFIVGDTDGKEALLQDEEIEWIVAQNDKEDTQLAVAFRQCATQLAKKPDKKKLGPQEESSKDRLAYFKEMADKYEHSLSWLGTPPSPSYQADAVFEKGMMANE